MFNNNENDSDEKRNFNNNNNSNNQSNKNNHTDSTGGDDDDQDLDDDNEIDCGDDDLDDDLDDTNGGDSFDNHRKKKTRTVFSRNQVFQLESTFDMKRYLSSSERSSMANSLQLKIEETNGKDKLQLILRQTTWEHLLLLHHHRQPIIQIILHFNLNWIEIIIVT